MAISARKIIGLNDFCVCVTISRVDKSFLVMMEMNVVFVSMKYVSCPTGLYGAHGDSSKTRWFYERAAKENIFTSWVPQT
jgi:hypothetical protein